MMRGLSSIPKVLSPTHGCPSDEPRNKCLLRCCWPQLLQGTPRQPSGTAQMGWYSSTSGLSPRGHLERQAEFHASTHDEA